MSYEMGNQRTGADNHQAEEHAEMLRLQDNKEDDEQVEHDEEMIDHARTDAVKPVFPQIVNNAYQGHQQYKDEGNLLIDSEIGIVKDGLETDQAPEMRNQ